MKNIWAPWRMTYILGEKTANCIFCEKPTQNNDKENYILFKGEHSFVMMNAYPYNNGHLLVSPYRHVDNLGKLSIEEVTELTVTVRGSIDILQKAMIPEGFNVGMNLGKVAGAGIEDHLHVHIVPRWGGDTNFMPVISETRVMPEHLESTYEKLLPFF